MSGHLAPVPMGRRVPSYPDRITKALSAMVAGERLDVKHLCIEFLRLIWDDARLCGHRPSGFAAAALYMARVESGAPLTINQVSTRSGVSEGLIRKNWHIIYEELKTKGVSMPALDRLRARYPSTNYGGGGGAGLNWQRIHIHGDFGHRPRPAGRPTGPVDMTGLDLEDPKD